jgi:hypothetical protein
VSSDPYSPDAAYPPPPGDFSPGLPPGPDRREIALRTSPPAVGLIIVGILNVLGALASAGLGTVYKNMPAEEFERQMRQQNPNDFAKMQQAGWTGRRVLDFCFYTGVGGGAVAAFFALLTVLGGIRMLALKSYGLAVTAAVVTAIPCISPSACCLLGEGIGIWALVVLLSPDVRSAFQQPPGPPPLQAPPY